LLGVGEFIGEEVDADDFVGAEEAGSLDDVETWASEAR
jgi:hypothetical protein